MSEYRIKLASNGYIVQQDKYIDVFEQHDEIPRALLEHLLAELIDEINLCTSTEFDVKVEVRCVPNTDTLTR